MRCQGVSWGRCQRWPQSQPASLHEVKAEELGQQEHSWWTPGQKIPQSHEEMKDEGNHHQDPGFAEADLWPEPEVHK